MKPVAETEKLVTRELEDFQVSADSKRVVHST